MKGQDISPIKGTDDWSLPIKGTDSFRGGDFEAWGV